MTGWLEWRGLLVFLSIFGIAGAAENDPPADEKARAEAFGVFAKQEAATYTVRLEGSDRPLLLQPKAVLKWSNPVIGSVYGDVFIWTDHGRPEVVASIYRFYSPPAHRANEFQSFAQVRVTAERNGAMAWTPSRPGLELKSIAGAPAPADSPSVRFRQMRSLAQEFTGRQTTREGIDREMRLLTQPIYRYENTTGDLIDGGLFVFVIGTDPEVFLLIEARRSSSGVPEWRFGATRMNSINLRLYHRGSEVWSVAELPWSQARDSREPYTMFGFDVEIEPK